MTPKVKFAVLYLLVLPGGIMLLALLVPKIGAIGFLGVVVWFGLMVRAIARIRCSHCERFVVQGGVGLRFLLRRPEPPGDACPHCGTRWG